MRGFLGRLSGIRNRRAFGRLVVSAVALIAIALPALADVDLGRLEAAKRAAEALLQRAAGSETSGAMPRRTDPEVARLLDQVFDVSVVGSEIVPITKIGPVNELVLNGTRVGTAYILAGTGKTEIPQHDRETLLRIDRNTATFAPEVGQFTDFQLYTTEAMARSALDFVSAATPTVLAQPRVATGLAQMRAGLGQVIGGVLKTFALAGLDDAWKLRRLAALDAVAATAARFLGDNEKASVKLVADEVAAYLGPELRERVRTFGQRFANPAR